MRVRARIRTLTGGSLELRAAENVVGVDGLAQAHACPIRPKVEAQDHKVNTTSHAKFGSDVPGGKGISYQLATSPGLCCHIPSP